MYASFAICQHSALLMYASFAIAHTLQSVNRRASGHENVLWCAGPQVVSLRQLAELLHIPACTTAARWEATSCFANRCQQLTTNHTYLCSFYILVSIFAHMFVYICNRRSEALASRATALADEVEAAIEAHGVVEHPTAGRVYAFEVDGEPVVLSFFLDL